MHSTDLASARGDVARLDKSSVTVAERQMEDANLHYLRETEIKMSIVVFLVLRRRGVVVWRRCFEVFTVAL